MPAGAGGSFAHDMVINRELSLCGFDSFGAPLHSGIVAPYILRYGTTEQKRRWLPRLATGELIGAIAMSEPGAGSDLKGIRTGAVRRGNGYVLNGAKTFITNGQHANLIIVVAKTDPAAGAKGVSLMVVETEGAQGFRREHASSRSWASTPPIHPSCSSTTCSAAGGSPARHRGGSGLRPVDDRLAAGAADRCHPRPGDARARARAHHRLCQRARSVRAKDHRVPEHPLRTGRMQDRGDRLAHLPRPLRRAPSRRRARCRDRLHGPKYWVTDIRRQK